MKKYLFIAIIVALMACEKEKTENETNYSNVKLDEPFSKVFGLDINLDTTTCKSPVLFDYFNFVNFYSQLKVKDDYFTTPESYIGKDLRHEYWTNSNYNITSTIYVYYKYELLNKWVPDYIDFELDNRRASVDFIYAKVKSILKSSFGNDSDKFKYLDYWVSVKLSNNKLNIYFCKSDKNF